MDHNDENKNQESLDLDDLLPEVGEFGRYQKLLLWLICLPACFPCGFCAFNQLFMTEVPPFWCKTPLLENLTLEQHSTLFPPRNNDSNFWKCYTYVLPETFEDLWAENYTSQLQVKKCDSGWEFNKTHVSSSIVIDFNLVCDKDIYPTLGLVALNLGGPFGVYLFGVLNDRIGRKKSFFICLTTLISGSIATAFSNDFLQWAGSRFIVGLTIPAIYQIPFIISLELVGPNYRSFVTVLTCMFYTLGLIMLSGITYLIRDWRYLSLATSVPFISYYIYWFYLPESPRWLLAKGRFEEASKILETLARVNKKELPASFKQSLKQRMMRKRTDSEEAALRKNPGCSDLCGTPNMRLKTTLITINWFATGMVYVGLSYYGPSLGSNEYLSFMLSSAVEIPSYLVCYLIMDVWGRRWPLCLSMIISGASCVATVLIPPEDEMTTLILFLVSKSAISASFLIIYPFAGELYPTSLRGIGIGTSAYIGGLGLIIIPFITYLGSENLILPLIIMGTVSVLGGITGLRLPETLHYRLPQNVEEGEEFGKDFTFQDCIRCIPLKPESSSATGSFENLELNDLKAESTEESPLNKPPQKTSLRRLTRKQSFMNTQQDVDGTMKMTYWF